MGNRDLAQVAEMRDRYEPIAVLKRVFGNNVPKEPVLCKKLCAFYNTKQCHCKGVPAAGMCGDFVVDAASFEEAEHKIEALVTEQRLH